MDPAQNNNPLNNQNTAADPNIQPASQSPAVPANPPVNSPQYPPNEPVQASNPSAPASPYPYPANQVEQPSQFANYDQNNQQYPPPPQYPPADSGYSAVSSQPPGHKGSFMFITLVLIVIVLGFGGSFAFFYMQNNKKPAVNQPVQISPTVMANVSGTPLENPFASPSGTYENPFSTPSSTFENPFGEYKNPFMDAIDSADNTYKNPFEELK